MLEDDSEVPSGPRPHTLVEWAQAQALGFRQSRRGYVLCYLCDEQGPALLVVLHKAPGSLSFRIYNRMGPGRDKVRSSLMMRKFILLLTLVIKSLMQFVWETCLGNSVEMFLDEEGIGGESQDCLKLGDDLWTIPTREGLPLLMSHAACRSCLCPGDPLHPE